MTIGARILAGCLTLSLLTALMGACGLSAERRLGGVATGIYDNAFMAMSYLRAAQVEFGRLAADGDAAAARAASDDLLGDLDVAIRRAMSPQAQAQARGLRDEVAHALPLVGTDRRGNAAVEQRFEDLVEHFAGDGFRDRRQIGLLIRAQQHQTALLLVCSLVVALIVTVLLARGIAPPIARAVGVAQSIASGRLDNTITVRGRGETAHLLRALALMQASIAAGMARIEALMQSQAATHADEIAAHNVKMTAALENMNQGLCLFDGEGLLRVSNRRYVEMFGTPRPGAHAPELLRAAGLAQLIDLAGRTIEALTCELDDGRTIAVSQQPIGDGGWVVTFEDVSERRAAEARLYHISRHDDLTGLPNRLLFSERLETLFAQPHGAARAPAAMLCLDLDRFKTINDTLGHPVGDALLQGVAARLLACCREEDFVARLGGDEFAIVQIGEQPNAAAALAQRLVDAIAEPFELAEHTVDIGLSVGVALVATSPSADELLKCADLALYRAKSDGRGCLRFFEPEMDLHARQRRALELELRHALKNDEFEIYYQPQVSHGTLAGFEALLRWQHPTRGLVNPADFIPLAEETGLIGAIGAWVLEHAARTAMTWPGAMKIAVNLSPAQFRTRHVAEDVRHALNVSGLPANRLELEITEALLMEEDGEILDVLNDVRGLGVRVAMDDFGTGYSSLAYLNRFPFDKIKIDQSFVREMGGSESAWSIIRAIIGLGNSLGMSVNAEGVETEEQRRRLLAEGCGELQGYLFGRPIPQGALPGVIRQFASEAAFAPHEVEPALS